MRTYLTITFAEGEVNIYQYLLSLRLGKYSPISVLSKSPKGLKGGAVLSTQLEGSALRSKPLHFYILF